MQYCMCYSKTHMLACYLSRPDAQLFDGQEEEEQQVNRELPDDIFRRQLINNLAKHVLFSKKITTHRCWLYYMHDKLCHNLDSSIQSTPTSSVS